MSRPCEPVLFGLRPHVRDVDDIDRPVWASNWSNVVLFAKIRSTASRHSSTSGVFSSPNLNGVKYALAAWISAKAFSSLSGSVTSFSGGSRAIDIDPINDLTHVVRQSRLGVLDGQGAAVDVI